MWKLGGSWTPRFARASFQTCPLIGTIPADYDRSDVPHAGPTQTRSGNWLFEQAHLPAHDDGLGFAIKRLDLQPGNIDSARQRLSAKKRLVVSPFKDIVHKGLDCPAHEIIDGEGDEAPRREPERDLR